MLLLPGGTLQLLHMVGDALWADLSKSLGKVLLLPLSSYVDSICQSALVLICLVFLLSSVPSISNNFVFKLLISICLSPHSHCCHYVTILMLM